MPVTILHLSDLHFGTIENAALWADQLIDDVTGELKCPGIDAMVVSGDVANFCTPEEYDAAREFFKQIMGPLKIEAGKLLIVPGNHDLNWEAAEDAYRLHKKAKYKGELVEGHYIDEGEKVVAVRDEADYKARFLSFSQFHKSVTGKDYPLEYGRQVMFCELTEQKVLIVGFNSAWELDYHFKARAAIHPAAVAHALSTIRSAGKYAEHLKIAVWHHPLNSPFEDRIKNHDFLERLIQGGFRIGLHGHLHESTTEQIRYELGPEGRKMHIIGAGTFGAPVKEWVDGVPLQYHLLTIDGRTLTVETRQRRKIEGAWKKAAIWDQWPDQDPLPRYFVQLPESAEVAAQTEAAEPDATADPALLEMPYLYKTWLTDHCSEMDFTRLIGTSRVIRATLPEIYIPLTTQPIEKEYAEPGMRLPALIMGMGEKEKDIEDLIAETAELVIEGKAGSGKTTLVKHMAYMTAEEKDWKGLGGWLPVLIFLKDLKGLRASGLSANSKGAEDILSHYFEATECGLDLCTVLSYCDANRAMFLLDGLDEIVPELRKTVAAAFAALRRRYPDCKFILSGRPHGVDDAVRRWFGKTIIGINPLNMGQVESFVHRWFSHVFEWESKNIQKTAEEMLGEVRAHQNIADLIETPLMLTAVCLLYLDERELPGQRAELYHKFIENLLHRRFQNPEKARNFLMGLAGWMHGEHVKGMDRCKATDILSAEFPKNPDESDLQYAARLEKAFDEMEPACALLECEDGQYGFQHLTFQEFLTAVAMAAGVRKDHAGAVRAFWDDPWYAEVIELYVGYLSIQNRGVANEIVLEQLEQEDSPPYSRWRLAMQALLDIHRDRRNPPVVEKARQCIWEIIRSEAEPKIRADAGELLGRIGDDRDLKAFVPIEGEEYKLSLGRQEIEAFEMGKFPVTNGWFREFVADNGYEREEFWADQGRIWLEKVKAKNPAGWFMWKWNCPNSPVVGVSWYEADAFVRWLNKTRDDGHRYFLPDENQWEAAAAGEEGRKYPWGSEWEENRCNSEESEIKKTSAVGIFSNGDTPEGVSDMAGNVWEWTVSNYHTQEIFSDFEFQEDMEDLWEKYQKVEGDEKEAIKKLLLDKLGERDRPLPVLRGGSWNINQDLARCACRLWNYPFYRDYFAGFRCART